MGPVSAALPKNLQRIIIATLVHLLCPYGFERSFVPSVESSPCQVSSECPGDVHKPMACPENELNFHDELRSRKYMAKSKVLSINA